MSITVKIRRDKLKLSIFIASKNRQKYLLQTLKSFELISNDFEVVISDNSDAPLSKQVLDSLRAKINIKYFHVTEPIPSVENFRRHIGQCSGQYITCIGDDDSVHPDIVDILSLFDDFHAPVIVGNLNYTYSWPGSLRFIGLDFLDKGVLKGNKSSLSVEVIQNDNRNLSAIANSGGFNYLSFQLPKLYHGFVQREVLLKIKDCTGQFVGGVSPDIYWSTILTLLTKWHIRVDFPLTLPGTCFESSSIQEGKLKANSNTFYDAPHLINYPNYKKNDEIPDFYCMETVWAESFLTALKDYGADELSNQFNSKILKQAIIQKKYSARVDRSSNLDVINKLSLTLKLFVLFLKDRYFSVRKQNSAQKIYRFNIDNIFVAQKILWKQEHDLLSLQCFVEECLNRSKSELE